MKWVYMCTVNNPKNKPVIISRPTSIKQTIKAFNIDRKRVNKINKLVEQICKARK